MCDGTSLGGAALHLRTPHLTQPLVPWLRPHPSPDSASCTEAQAALSPPSPYLSRGVTLDRFIYHPKLSSPQGVTLDRFIYHPKPSNSQGVTLDRFILPP